jgi:predicted amidohydrolase YtcJ
VPVTRIEAAAMWSTSRRGPVVIDESGIRAVGPAAAELPVDEVVTGGFLSPGFRDGHAHPLFAGLESSFAAVRGLESVEEVLAAVSAWADAHRTAEWVRGEGFDPALAPSAVFRAEWLDRVVRDRPVALRAWDYHTVWANTAALRLAGIDAATPDPPGGEIVRDADGTPVGTLREIEAWRSLYASMPPVPDAQMAQAVASAGAVLAAAGVTWVQDAWVDHVLLAAWREHGSAFGPRVDLALLAEPGRWRDQDLPGLAASVPAPLTARTVKFFADGVIESGTGALLEPYCDCPGSRGLPLWAPEELAEAVTAADAAGLAPHIHAIGDAAVRSALDAIEHAIRINGPRDRRPVIAHLQLVSEVDLPRIAQLGVIANVEPFWAQWDSSQHHLTEPRLGPERAQRQYPLRTLVRSGAAVTFGSDWPVTRPEPLAGIQIAVTRQATADAPPWVPDERLSVDEALRAATSGAQAGEAARIAPGERADLVLLGEDPREVRAQEIGRIEVVATWRGGVRLH